MIYGFMVNVMVSLAEEAGLHQKGTDLPRSPIFRTADGLSLHLCVAIQDL